MYRLLSKLLPPWQWAQSAPETSGNDGLYSAKNSTRPRSSLSDSVSVPAKKPSYFDRFETMEFMNCSRRQ